MSTAVPSRMIGLIMGLSVLIGLGRLKSNPPSMLDDQTDNWWPVSMSILDGQGYVECLPLYFPFCGPGNDATAMREPVPVFLFAAVAAIHRSLWAAALMQLLLNALIVLMVHRLANELGGARVALIAALLWALHLPAVQVLPQIAGDLVATLAVVTGLWLYVRAWRSGDARHWILAGVCMALAVLSRSALLATCLPLGLGVVWHARRSGNSRMAALRPTLLFGVTWLLVMLPWMVRNYITFQQPVIGSTLTGYNILRHNYQLPTAAPYRYISAEEAEPVTRAALDRHPELTGHENEAQVDRIYKAEGQAVIRANKGRYAVLCAYRFLPLWFNWKVNDAYGKPSDKLDYLMMLQQAALLVLSLIGLRHADRRLWPLALSVLVLCLAYMMIVARMRYTLPVMPVVIVLAAIAIEQVRVRFSRDRAAGR